MILNPNQKNWWNNENFLYLHKALRKKSAFEEKKTDFGDNMKRISNLDNYYIATSYSFEIKVQQD